jgi:adenylate kinase family enzyme
MRIAIVGNSGSGKSSLASALAEFHHLPQLDLDTVAWVPHTVGVPRDAAEAVSEVTAFCLENESFVVEGCYENLIAATLPHNPRLLFLDVDADICEAHCRARPFEPHKYDTVTAQNDKLEFLLQWVRGYYTRQGPMSRTEHVRLFDSYTGRKSRYIAEVALNNAGEIVEARSVPAIA